MSLAPALSASEPAAGEPPQEDWPSEDKTETFYRPEDIALAIEIVSPESVERDHEVKPGKYARAGIRNLWLVERDGEGVIAYVYTLDPLTGDYSLIGTFGDRLKVSVPFDIAIDFGTLDDFR
jgi:Uma2 family endonuclease